MEKALFSVEVRLNDGDFEDVFRVYSENEKGSDKKIAMITSVIAFLICFVIFVSTKNITFVFYGIACIVVGISYLLVPVNKKFIANNKLQFGEQRRIVFYQHSVGTEEIFDNSEEYEDSEDSMTEISTVSMSAYENARGFLFADGKIVNNFLYIPKRQLDEAQEEQIRKFAKENCSGEYHLLEAKSMIDDEETVVDEQDNEETAMTDAVCSQYYGASKLRLYDDDGHRIDTDDDDDEDADALPSRDVSEESLDIDVDAEPKETVEDADE